MGGQKLLEQYRDQINQCARCGSCQAQCPVYEQNRSEGSVARGKLSLAKALLDGTISLEKRLEQDFSLCLLCGSCVLKCPNKVPTDKIVAAMRQLVTENKGLGLSGRAVSTLTGSSSLMNTLAKSAGRIQHPFLKKVDTNSGLRLRFPIPGMKDRSFPEVPKKQLLELYPEVIKGQNNKPIVGFFAGCSINYLYPQVGQAVIDILHHFGYSIVLPKKQVCCGFPAKSAGDGEQKKFLENTNRKAFTSAGIDFIVTACATCSSGLLESMSGSTSQFGDTILDIHVFLHKQGITDSIANLEYRGETTRITYHDPCHLRTKGITSEPRQLLKSLPSVQFIEMQNAGRCCGLGGTFSLHHYQTSKAIGQKKIAPLADTNVEYIATGCPGCIIQLQDAINHYGLKVKAIHTLELVSKFISALPSKNLLGE